MSSRDFRHRESKKVKKESKKALKVSVLSPQATVEVIPKGKQTKEVVEA